MTRMERGRDGALRRPLGIRGCDAGAGKPAPKRGVPTALPTLSSWAVTVQLSGRERRPS